MGNWIRNRAKLAMDYLAIKVSQRIEHRLSDVIKSQLDSQLNAMRPYLTGGTSQTMVDSRAIAKAVPLTLNSGDSHIYFHNSDGHRFFLDATDHHITLHVLEHGCWEDHIRDVIMQILKPGSTFVDVGGNVGLHTLFAGSIVGQTGKVYSFEPVPHLYGTLRLNVDVNGMGNVIKTHQLAVSDTEEVKSFSKFRSHSAMSGFSVPQVRLDIFGESENSSVEVIQVNTVTLDKMFAGQKIDGLKIDVEGYETLVLRGAKEVIRNNRDIKLIIEWDPFLVTRTLGSEAITENIAFLESERFIPYLALWQQPLRKVTWDEVSRLQGDLILTRTGSLR
ncbi:FkbM family methyltransferase [Mesorhizobium sp. CU2]|uniref:FkbM family methyltransferase n=1 Tax=unclassified Mesorhizobium TaxID=325217 RepID=UPI00112BE935|nr:MULTISPECIES: FkbM family methyltransferase [unclassified Mesorhizobium]TPN83196.1 FkbM family methyltransferase [Mesorhizobium sp. CU3]TPO12208.1 FkbM family methyltransferase [Mesorhizobium sp. CU2]